MTDREVQEIAAVIAHQLGSRYEVSPRDKDDEQRRDRHDASQDPWGYDDPPQERDDA